MRKKTNFRSLFLVAILYMAVFLFIPDLAAEETKEEDLRKVSSGTYIDVEGDRKIEDKGGTRLMVEPGKYIDLEANGTVQRDGKFLQVESDNKYMDRRLGKIEKEIGEIHATVKEISEKLSLMEKKIEEDAKRPKVLSA